MKGYHNDNVSSEYDDDDDDDDDASRIKMMTIRQSKPPYPNEFWPSDHLLIISALRF